MSLTYFLQSATLLAKKNGSWKFLFIFFAIVGTRELVLGGGPHSLQGKMIKKS